MAPLGRGGGARAAWGCEPPQGPPVNAETTELVVIAEPGLLTTQSLSQRHNTREKRSPSLIRLSSLWQVARHLESQLLGQNQVERGLPRWLSG